MKEYWIQAFEVVQELLYEKLEREPTDEEVIDYMGDDWQSFICEL